MEYWQPTAQDYIDMEAADADAAAAAQEATPVISISGSSDVLLAPETAALLGEGRRAVASPLSVESPKLSEGSVLSNASQDSFDWIGDDRRTEESDYEDAFFEELAAPPPSPTTTRTFRGCLCHSILLVLFIACLAISLVKEMGIPLPIIWGVGLHQWVLILFLTIFVPVWTNSGMGKLAGFLKSTRLAKTEYPVLLEAATLPLTLMISPVIVGLFWYTNFPHTCTADPSSFTHLCYYTYIPRLFLFLSLAGSIIALDVFAMMSIRSSFQEKTFKNKIIESRFKVHVVDQLVAAARQEKISRTIGDDRGHGNVQSTDWQFMYNLPFIIPSLILRVFRSRQRSAIDGGLPDFVEYSEQIARSLQTRGYESVATAPPLTDHKAKIMARMTFHYLSCGRKILTREDFSRIIKNEAASCDAYAIFDADGDGTITRSEFRSAVVKVFREQRNLGQSIANTGSALSVLDTISMIVVGAGLFLLLLALLGVKVQNILGVSASFILGMNFIIYDAANKTFHALLFLFVMHPYDIGDRVVIGKDIGYGDEDVMTVAHINIQNTVFRRWNSLLVSIPNHILAGGPVSNLSRGTEQWERIEFSLEAPDSQRLTVDEETNRLADMRHRIETFVLQYPQDYYQSFELRAVIAADSAKSEKNLDAIKFVLKIRCKETLDSQKKWIRHARILAFVKTVVKQVGVELAAIAA